ncbi:heme biosynthesis protein HemY [Rhodospirillum rubrum]|uniref:HesB/IscA family protein n=1 Tax=Rhodospirillum rubrum TaxID=1085 RepID=UPI001905FD6C|nr:iron-sulfur cluster assembly accessory protein [Rhodospirillum rubrum]MBK1663612.1 heme biosynthesis protein HemY [Rhodospirillum rubrum]MBK1675951.1 heme biosynthesis protein HemY [Rhodospirillum rubrum]
MSTTATTIRITERAARKVDEFHLRGDLDPTLAIRLDVVGGAASGIAYDLYFDQVDSDDQVFESQGLRIAIRPRHAPWLLGSTVDWVESDNGAGFQVLNPNVPPQ